MTKHIGYKIAAWDGEKATSLYKRDLVIPIDIGSELNGRIYLGTTRKFVVDYYSGGTDLVDILLIYSFDSKDILKGSLSDSEGEIIVSRAKLIKYELLL